MELCGNFSFIECGITRTGLENTYQAITNCQLWEELKQYCVDNEKGFMFSSDVLLTKIYRETERLQTGHSGASWGFCMRTMDYIAKNGWQQYKYYNL